MIVISWICLTPLLTSTPSFETRFVPIEGYNNGIEITSATDTGSATGATIFRSPDSYRFKPLFIDKWKFELVNVLDEQGDTLFDEVQILKRINSSTLISSMINEFDKRITTAITRERSGLWIPRKTKVKTQWLTKSPNGLTKIKPWKLAQEKVQKLMKHPDDKFASFDETVAKLNNGWELRTLTFQPWNKSAEAYLFYTKYQIPILVRGNEFINLSQDKELRETTFLDLAWKTANDSTIFFTSRKDRLGLLWIKNKRNR